jgi:phage regulator Rha-like protein
MSTAVQPFSHPSQTLNSREIAELTGKDHAHVLRDIRDMLDVLKKDASIFGGIYQDAYGRDQPCFNLDRELTITLVSGYDIPLRHRVVTRLTELEATKAAIDPKCLSRMQILEMALQSEKQKEAALLALDVAVATKAEIGSRREATSMAKASSAVRERNKILKELGRAQTTATIRAVNKATGGDYQFRLLRDWCNFTEVQIDRVPDPLYGEVNTYPAAAWRAVYGIDLAKVFAESNFAPRELNDSTEVGS